MQIATVMTRKLNAVSTKQAQNDTASRSSSITPPERTPSCSLLSSSPPPLVAVPPKPAATVTLLAPNPTVVAADGRISKAVAEDSAVRSKLESTHESDSLPKVSLNHANASHVVHAKRDAPPTDGQATTACPSPVAQRASEEKAKPLALLETVPAIKQHHNFDAQTSELDTPLLIVEDGKVKRVISSADGPMSRESLLERVGEAALRKLRKTDMTTEDILHEYFLPISHTIMEASIAMQREYQEHVKKKLKSPWRGVVRVADGTFHVNKRFGGKLFRCKGFSSHIDAAIASDGVQRFLLADKAPSVQQIEFNFPVKEGEVSAMLPKVERMRERAAANSISVEKPAAIIADSNEGPKWRSSRLRRAAEMKLENATKFPPFPTGVRERQFDDFIPSTLRPKRSRKRKRKGKESGAKSEGSANDDDTVLPPRRSRSGRRIKPVSKFVTDNSDYEGQHLVSRKRKSDETAKESGKATAKSSSKKRSRSSLPWPKSFLARADVAQILSKLGDDDRVKLWDTTKEKILAGNCTPLKPNVARALTRNPHLQVYIGQNFDGWNDSNGSKPLSKLRFIRVTDLKKYKKMMRKKAKAQSTKSKKKAGKEKLKERTVVKLKKPKKTKEPEKKKAVRPKKVKLNYKINFKDMLKSPNSILTAIDMREIINPATLSQCLSQSERCALYSLLPEADLGVGALETLGRSHFHFDRLCSCTSNFLCRGHLIATCRTGYVQKYVDRAFQRAKIPKRQSSTKSCGGATLTIALHHQRK